MVVAPKDLAPPRDPRGDARDKRLRAMTSLLLFSCVVLLIVYVGQLSVRLIGLALRCSWPIAPPRF